MSKTPTHGSLATRLAALQQGMAAPFPVGILSADAPDEGLALELPPQAARPKGYAGPEQTTNVPKGNAKIMDSRQLAEGGQGPTRAAAGFGAKGPISARSAKPTLIGASKSQPVALLEEAIALGLRDFGENKVQEAADKWPALKARHPAVRLHLIGPLQSNKAAEAVALFDVIHTIDRIKIADALAKALARTTSREAPGVAFHGEPEGRGFGGDAPISSKNYRVAFHGEPEGRGFGGDAPTRTTFATPKFLIQVNTGEEPQKAGAHPRDVAALLAHCRGLGLPIIGLMCVPPAGENPAPHFALMKKMADALGLAELSMGMSEDYETALRLGATMIRVGTALFGGRL